MRLADANSVCLAEVSTNQGGIQEAFRLPLALNSVPNKKKTSVLTLKGMLYSVMISISHEGSIRSELEVFPLFTRARSQPVNLSLFISRASQIREWDERRFLVSSNQAEE